MENPEEFAAKLDELSTYFADPTEAAAIKKAAEDMRKGKSRSTVARDLRKIKDRINDPRSAPHAFIERHLAHFSA
ncbi:MAG: hypothetical protein JWR80_9500 [Bradyrhizobium sp.]|nr:hypothetical protein [Bradyrhizobium sp.]